MAETMEALEIEVKHKATGATDEINQLADALLRLNRYLAGTTIPKLEGFAKALHRVQKAEANVSKAINQPKTSKGKNTVAEQLSDGMKEGIRNLEKYEVAWLKLQNEKDKMESAMDQGDAVGAVYGRDKVLKAEAAYNKEYYKKFPVDNSGEEEKESAWERINRVLDKVQGKLRGVKKETSNVAKSGKKTVGVFGNLFNSIKRIAFYRVIRKVLNEIAKAAQEGLKNAYAYSSIIGSSISQTMDSLASVTLTMKNQFGSALGELLTTIQPILEYIIRLITKAADAVSQFFAILGGRSTYHKALDSSAKWAETTQEGAEAAQEWKKQLMGFDEINRLDAPTEPSSAAGSKKQENIGNWELSPVTMDFPWLDKLKEFFASIDFEPLKKAARDLGDAFKRLGDTIGKAIAWAWDNILAPFIQWFLEKALPVVLEFGAALVDLANAVLTRLGPVFQMVWDNVLKPIFAWIGDEFVFIFQRLTEIIKEFSRVISGEIDFQTFWDNLSTSEQILVVIIGVITAISVAMFALSNPLLAIAAVVAVVAAILVKHWDVIKAKWDEVIGKIKEKLTEWKEAWDEFAANNLEKSEELRQKIWEKIEDVKGFFQDLADKWSEIKEAVAQKIDELRDKWEEFKGEIQEKIDVVKEFFQGLHDKWGEIVDGIQEKIETIKERFDDFRGKAQSVTSAVSGFFSGMYGAVSGVVNGVISVVKSIIEWCEKAASAIKALASSRISGGGGGGESESGSGSGGTTISPSGFSGNSGKFATGGFPDEGQMFIAREAGPELVGTIGNRTAVATNADIVAAIEGGVYNAMASALSASGGNSSGTKVAVLNVNGREFARAIFNDQQAVVREHGVSLVANG